MIASEDSHVDANAHALVANMMNNDQACKKRFERTYQRRPQRLYQVEENKGTRLLACVADVIQPSASNKGFSFACDAGYSLPKLLFIERETEVLKTQLCSTGKTPP